jgi:electron-transferring-flavoprotein dehydrogenase
VSDCSDDAVREVLEVDLLFVGAGTATLSAVIRLADLCREREIDMPSILVIEKAAEIGGHQLSGAVIDTTAIQELFPNYEDEGFPIQHRVTEESVYFLSEKRSLRLPIAPPPMANHGNIVLSASELVQWLAAKAEEREIEIYPGFAARKPLYDGERVAGVQIQDAGIGQDGKPRGTFEPGPEIRAKCTIFGEGSRGSCTKEIVERFGIAGTNPQAYETGVKEIWRIKPENHRPGRVIHTMFWPHDGGTFGGSWIYDMKDDLVSVGFVTGLNYESPYTDPHDNMQRFKLHPMIRKILDGGECIRYGAKTMPVGGLHTMPRLAVDGAMLVGDSAGFCNGGRLKGIHMAMKSGMIAAETLIEAIEADDFSAAKLLHAEVLFKESWAYKEHRAYRNFHASFDWAQKMPEWLPSLLRQLPFLLNSAVVAMVTGGRGLVSQIRTHQDHTHMKKLDELTKRDRRKANKVEYDNKYTFDKVTAVALAGSMHEPDQPPHLVVADTDLCSTRCVEEYGNPCQHFCPADVYEMIPNPGEESGQRLVIHHENCVHCKTCDVADPYAQITWTTPQGGEGPDYTKM